MYIKTCRWQDSFLCYNFKKTDLFPKKGLICRNSYDLSLISDIWIASAIIFLLCSAFKNNKKVHCHPSVKWQCTCNNLLIPVFEQNPKKRRPDYSATAIASTSQSTFFGSCFTATQERAGLLVKYFSYTALNAVKSAISARKQVVLITLSNVSPASSRIAPTFLQDCSACASILSPTTSPVAGSTGIWPDANTKLPAIFAWEYGPIAAGAFFVSNVFIIIPPVWFGIFCCTLILPLQNYFVNRNCSVLSQ